MKVLKTITALCIATFLSFNISAQAAATPAAKAATTQAKPAPTAATPDKPGANDKVNKALKGPNGEAVYTGPKGGNYYINKNTGKKGWIKKPAAAPAK